MAKQLVVRGSALVRRDAASCHGRSVAPTVDQPPLVVPDGSIAAAKWIALALMTFDHINKFVFAEGLPGVYEFGRLSMPLFVFVLAYNLARPGALEKGVYGRTCFRLCIAGLVATPVFVSLVGWWPTNIMFMLALSTAVIWAMDRGGRWRLAIAALLFVVAGAFVEFWWPAVALCVAAWCFCRRPTALRGLWVGLACASLFVVNRNHWALASLPLAFVLSRVSLRGAPVSQPGSRLRLFFYCYYPGHLAVLWLAMKSI